MSAVTYTELGTRGKGQWQAARFRTDPSAVFEVEDFATALIRFENGASLQLDTSWAGYTRHGDEFGASFMGSQGGAEIHVKDYAETDTLEFYGDIDNVPTVTRPTLLKRHGHGELIEGFAEAILEGHPVTPDGNEGLERVKLIEAIYRSADLGHEVPFA